MTENNINYKTSSKYSDVSYVHRTSDIPFLHDTTADRLRFAAQNFPNKIMVIFPECGIRKTYQQVFDDARQLGAALIHLNLQKGQRIAIWSPNYYEWIVTKYAAAFAGLIIVGINPEYKADELKYVLQKVGVAAIVSPSKDSTNDYYHILCEIIPEILEGENGVESKDLPELKNIILFKTDEKLNGAWNFDEIMKMPKKNDFEILDDWESQIRVDDPFFIMFTSGTTGRPKAATHSHHGVINNAYLLGLGEGFQYNNEILCIPLPLFGCGAFIFGSLCSLVHCETIIFPARNAKSVLKAINDEKATMLTVLPSVLIELVNHPDLPLTDTSSIRGGIIGGATIPESICKKVVEKLGMKNYINAYGSTEMAMTVVSFPEDARIVKPIYVMPHMEAAIICKNGKIVKRGEKGEIVVRGYSIMQGYWNDEEKTKEVYGKDRWYHTGDIGSMASDGSIEVCGRFKDVIIRGGFNFYPAEIENFILQHPSIADACVFGVPDKKYGEEICAWIRLKLNETLTEKELIDFLESRISTSKIPRYFLFKLKHEFPMTPSGKVMKYELQKLTLEELSLENVTSYCEN